MSTHACPATAIINTVISNEIRTDEHRRTSCVDAAKLGNGLARPSMLLYRLAPCCCTPRIDCSPRMLPGLSVVRQSGCNCATRARLQL